MLKILHNPRCSKSREALALLQQQPFEIEVIDYQATPLSEAAIAHLLKQLELPARALLRTKEDEYQQLGLADHTLTEQQLIAAMAKHPKLIERPIIIKDNKAVIGRPVSNILSLL